MHHMHFLNIPRCKSVHMHHASEISPTRAVYAASRQELKILSCSEPDNWSCSALPSWADGLSPVECVPRADLTRCCVLADAPPPCPCRCPTPSSVPPVQATPTRPGQFCYSSQPKSDRQWFSARHQGFTWFWRRIGWVWPWATKWITAWQFFGGFKIAAGSL